MFIILDTAVKLAGWNRKRPKGMRLSQTQLPRSRRTNPFQCMLKWRKAASIYVSHACWRDSPFQYRWESEGLKGCPNFPEKKKNSGGQTWSPPSQSQRWCPLVCKETWIIWWSQEEIWWILVSANSISRLSNKWALFNPANYSHLPSKSFSYGLTTLAHTFAILQWCIPHTRATPRWNMMAHERFWTHFEIFWPSQQHGHTLTTGQLSECPGLVSCFGNFGSWPWRWEHAKTRVHEYVITWWPAPGCHFQRNFTYTN